MKKLISFVAVVSLLSGCATINEHPKTSLAILSIVATSIALSSQQGNSQGIALNPPTGLPCHPQPNGTCR